MSTHGVFVTTVESVQHHPNADRLDVAVVDGYECIVKRDAYKAGDACLFVPPDYEVPVTNPIFAFLEGKAGADGYARIKAMNLRGTRSFGLVTEVPDGMNVGDNVLDMLKIRRWEPPTERPNAKAGWMQAANSYPEYAPAVAAAGKKYDLENIQKYRKKFDGQYVYCTEKIHGQNGRFVYSKADDQMFCGSRTRWVKRPGVHTKQVHRLVPIERFFLFAWVVAIVNAIRPFTFATTREVSEYTHYTVPESNWWAALRQNPWIEEWCRKNPDHIVYGEVYGPGVQGPKFAYGKAQGEFGVRVFDIREPDGQFVDNCLFHPAEGKWAGLEYVPVIIHGVFDYAKIKEEAEKNSIFAGQKIREGLVVKAATEADNENNRLAHKYVSERYYNA